MLYAIFDNFDELANPNRDKLYSGGEEKSVFFRPWNRNISRTMTWA